MPKAQIGHTISLGEQILEEEGILILPVLFMSISSVTVSYFKFVENLGHINRDSNQ